MGANSGTPYLWGAGSSNNGLLQSGVQLLGASDTGFQSLANASTVQSSASGTSGVFNNSNTGQAVLADVFLTLGAIATALSAGANLAGWFLLSPDGGATFENYVSGAAPPRPPDFYIPLPATTITAGWKYKSVGVHKVIVPATYFKVVVQNYTGQTFAASGNVLMLASPTLDY